MNLIQREPVAVAGGIELLIKAVAGLGFAFDWFSWSDAQLAAVLLVESAVFGLVFLLVRGNVTPTGGTS
jgi:hypothetical protein